MRGYTDEVSVKPRPDMQLVAGNKLHVWTE